jgi:serine/threonine-protein kinase HipA
LENYYVYIYLNGSYQKCALLTYDGGSYTLAYGKIYLTREDRIAIDPKNLPLYEKNFESENIFGAIKDSAPDRWGRYLLEKKFNRDLTEMEYVLANSLEHVGALAFSPMDYDVPMLLTPKGYVPHNSDRVSLEKIMDQTELALSDEDGEKLRELLQYGPSLGGARPKYTIYHDDGPYLAKFSVSQDKRREPLIEYACMSMAKDLGLNVPEIRLEKIAGRDVYSIKRFDRKSEMKHPFISALSLCNWDESGYYEWSYPLLCEALINIGKNQTMINEDLKELFKRVAFNIAVNNDDDHPRNHGVYYRQGIWRLSPLYDVVAKDVSSHTFSLAMEIGTQKREASKTNLLSAIKYFRLEKKEAEEIINEVFSFTEKNWRKYFETSGLNTKEVSRFETAMKIKN